MPIIKFVNESEKIESSEKTERADGSLRYRI